MSLDLDALTDEARARVGAADSLDALEGARVALLGRKGTLTGALKSLGTLPPEEKPAAGQALNRVKQTVQGLLEERRVALEDARLAERLASDALDVTLPGAPPPAGGLHPITLTIARITALFSQLGFHVATGPEIEDDWHNFEALNFPPNHPAREMHDTFWFDPHRLLRTHTSPGADPPPSGQPAAAPRHRPGQGLPLRLRSDALADVPPGRGICSSTRTSA